MGVVCVSLSTTAALLLLVASCSASGVYVFPGAIIEHKDLAAEAEEDGPSIKKAKVDM